MLVLTTIIINVRQILPTTSYLKLFLKPLKPLESFSSKVVLLAAKEYNREDYDGQEVRDSGQGVKPVNKITCEDNEILDTRNSKERSEDNIGPKDSEKNVETAWTSRSMSTVGTWKKEGFLYVVV